MQGDFVGDVWFVRVEQLLDGAGDMLGIDAGLQMLVSKGRIIRHCILAKDEVCHAQTSIARLIKQCVVHLA